MTTVTHIKVLRITASTRKRGKKEYKINVMRVVLDSQFEKKCKSKKIKNVSGESGHRSRYLSHAKRALYHLS